MVLQRVLVFCDRVVPLSGEKKARARGPEHPKYLAQLLFGWGGENSGALTSEL